MEGVGGKLFEAFSSGVPVEVPASYTVTCAGKTQPPETSFKHGQNRTTQRKWPFRRNVRAADCL